MSFQSHSTPSQPNAAAPEHKLFYTTLRSNLGSICRCGYIPSPAESPPGYEDPWSKEITSSRAKFRIPVDGGQTLDCFVALTGTSRTPAAYNVATGHGVKRVPNGALALFITTAESLIAHDVDFIVATAQPLSASATFVVGQRGVNAMDWPLIKSGSFSRDAADPYKLARVGAEVLASRAVPLAAIRQVIVWGGKEEIEAVTLRFPSSAEIEVVQEPRHFFTRGA